MLERHKAAYGRVTSLDCPPRAVAWYLIAAYCYYELDNPIMEDREFDDLAKALLLNFDTIEHMHKHLLSKEMLEAGTYIGQYPEIVKDTAKTFL